MRKLLLALVIILAISLPALAGTGVNSRVRLSIDGQLITGAFMKYNWANNTGVITDFRTESDGLIITGSKARIEDGVIYVEDASITKCDLPQPEYELYTKLLTYELDSQRLTTKGTWIKIYGHKVIPEPSITMVLDDSRFGRLSREEMPRPILGADTTRGVYAGVTYQTLAKDNTDSLLRTTLIYATETKWEGDLTYIHRVGHDETVTASWLHSPDHPYDLGGLKYDYTSGDGNLIVALGQYREENDQVLRYLPELRFFGAKNSWSQGPLTLSFTPTLRSGSVSSPANPAEKVLRLSASTTFSGQYLLAPDFYLTTTGGIKTLTYWSPIDPDPYRELTETTYLKRRVGNSTFGLGHQGSWTEGAPYFGELDPVSEQNYGLLYYGYTNARVSAAGTLKYDLETARFDTATYTAGVSGSTGTVKYASTLNLKQDLIQNRLDTVSYSSSLNWQKWDISANLEYSFSQAKWSEGQVVLVRMFHCYGLQFDYDAVEDKLGGKIVFNW